MAFSEGPDFIPFLIKKSNAVSKVEAYHKNAGIISFTILAVSLFFLLFLFSTGKDLSIYPLTIFFMVINSIIFTLIGIKLLIGKINNEDIHSKLSKFSKTEDIPFKLITSTKYGSFMQFYSVVYGLLVLIGIFFKF